MSVSKEPGYCQYCLICAVAVVQTWYFKEGDLGFFSLRKAHTFNCKLGRQRETGLGGTLRAGRGDVGPKQSF